MRAKHHFNEKLIRSYFRQLIKGVEFLHTYDAAHLDLKLENLLLGENFQLKIADFDLSYLKGDQRVHALGSKCYRAPEILSRTCTNPKPADIYSIGIILFMMQSQGVLPHLENEKYQGVNLFEALGNDLNLFWKKHIDFHRERVLRFSQEFKDLFIGMTRTHPKERFTIQDIKNSKWYNGEVYSSDELTKKMRDIM